jgi:hypothetical protein
MACQDGLTDDEIEWEVTRAFCNAILRKGMELEADQMQEIMQRLRKNRAKALSKHIVKGAYEAIRE